jgi:hypothetical protein
MSVPPAFFPFKIRFNLVGMKIQTLDKEVSAWHWREPGQESQGTQAPGISS